MNLWIYRTTQVLSVMMFLVGEVVLLLALGWIILGHGVIACGRGLFDSPTLFLDLFLIIGAPTIVMVGSWLLFSWSEKRGGTPA